MLKLNTNILISYWMILKLADIIGLEDLGLALKASTSLLHFGLDAEKVESSELYMDSL